MRTSLIVSGILHLVLFAAIFLNFATGDKTVTPPRGPVPVEITMTSDITEQKAGKADGKAEKTTPPKFDDKKTDAAPEPVANPQLTQKASVKQAAAAAPPPPKSEPAPEPEKKPEIEKKVEPEKKPEPEKAAEAEKKQETVEPAPEKKPEPAKPKKQVEDKPKPKPKPKPETAPDFNKDRIADILKQKAPEQQTKFDPNRISALLNKDPNAGDVPPSDQRPKLGRPPSSFQDQALGVEQGSGDKLTGNEIDAFVRRMEECWDLPGGLGGEVVQVKLRIELRPNGDLARPPQVVNSGNSTFFQAAADSAVRAVEKCAPYSFMPPDKYDQWRDMTMNFNPSEMLR